MITMCSLGDPIGRRRLLLIGAATFSIASVLAAYSTSPQMLIATRALLAITGATLSRSTLALISKAACGRRPRDWGSRPVRCWLRPSPGACTQV